VRRRAFLAALSGAAAWPIPAWAQKPAVPVIGFLGSESSHEWVERLDAFRRGLSETGLVEGTNLSMEYRWAEGLNERLPALAADLVRRQVDMIAVLGGTGAALVAKAATTTIPIVFRIASNPVDVELVASLNRPGGNVTGVTTLGVELAPKQLALLRELVPGAATFALLVNPTNTAIADRETKDLEAAAARLGVKLLILHASAERDFDPAFAALNRQRADGLVIAADTFFNARSTQLAAQAVNHAVPTVSPYREFATAGGLMSYGGNVKESNREAGVYAGRILKGEKPADLPVVEVTKIEHVINVKTAKALGIAVPATFIARADEVIE
jgi:putative tryptophan/tyrosine transport system substrate-binding protein